MAEREKMAVERRNEELKAKLAGFEEAEMQVEEMGGEEKVHNLMAEMEQQMIH
jgi:hypothetical protein